MYSLLVLGLYALCSLAEPVARYAEEPSNRCPRKSHSNRVIGYYEGWALSPDKRNCDTLTPEAIPRGVYTHINFAFATINPKTFEVRLPDKGSYGLLERLTAQKRFHPGLEVWIAIGGWSFSERNSTTFTTFSDLAASADHQRKFFSSLNKFVHKYHLDGVDIDCLREYPGTADRGGRPQDNNTYPVFLERLKAALRSPGQNRDKGLSVAIPVGKDSLEYFDLKKMSHYVDWFNVMSYDLHGAWEIGGGGDGPESAVNSNITKLETLPNTSRYNLTNQEKLPFTAKSHYHQLVLEKSPVRSNLNHAERPTSTANSYTTRPRLFRSSISSHYNLNNLSKVINSQAGLVYIPEQLTAPVNSHTNLTELVEPFDLFLRQGIPPYKIVMGLAFYGRGFTLTDAQCFGNGCSAKAVAQRGPCGADDPGILFNSEIQSKIKQKGLNVTLDQIAAVEIAHWDDQWITFDSERTFELRSRFARSNGISGFMVWAMSQDDIKGTSSRALGRGLGRCV